MAMALEGDRATASTPKSVPTVSNWRFEKDAVNGSSGAARNTNMVTMMKTMVVWERIECRMTLIRSLNSDILNSPPAASAMKVTASSFRNPSWPTASLVRKPSRYGPVSMPTQRYPVIRGRRSRDRKWPAA